MSVAPPILPQQRDTSILTTARPLPVGFDVWRDGLTFIVGYDARRFKGAGICDAVPETTGGAREWATFLPFLVSQEEGCGEATPAMASEEIARVREVFDVALPDALENQLVRGSYVPTSPAFVSVAQPVSSAPHTATGMLNGIALLLQARGNAVVGGPTVITGPERLVPWLVEAGVVTERNGVLAGAGWRYLPTRGYGLEGPWVDPITFASSAGPQDPGSATGALTAAAGEAWIYASGPIEYDEIDVMRPEGESDEPFDADRYWAWRMNTAYILLRREAIVRFDPKFVYAVKVTIPTT